MSSKLQEVVNNIESLLTNKTLRETGNKGEIALAASALLQSTETMALEAALKAPELRLQKVQNSTVGKTTIRMTHFWDGLPARVSVKQSESNKQGW
jgi:hypothetical protein